MDEVRLLRFFHLVSKGLLIQTANTSNDTQTRIIFMGLTEALQFALSQYVVEEGIEQSAIKRS